MVRADGPFFERISQLWHDSTAKLWSERRPDRMSQQRRREQIRQQSVLPSGDRRRSGHLYADRLHSGRPPAGHTHHDHQLQGEADNPIYHTARAIFLSGQVMHRLIRGRCGQRQIMDHLISAGPRCLASVMLTNSCAGAIFAIQSAREMARFGSLGTLGSVFAAAYCRELAPLPTAGTLSTIRSRKDAAQLSRACTAADSGRFSLSGRFGVCR